MREDTISRQAAIQETKELFKMGDCYCDEHSIVGMLNSLPSAQPEPRWIPVTDKEQLPKDGQRVLVTDEDGEIEIACFIDFSSIDESAEWWSHDYRCHPIAWRELPKPYERSEDE